MRGPERNPQGGRKWKDRISRDSPQVAAGAGAGARGSCVGGLGLPSGCSAGGGGSVGRGHGEREDAEGDEREEGGGDEEQGGERDGVRRGAAAAGREDARRADPPHERPRRRHGAGGRAGGSPAREGRSGGVGEGGNGACLERDGRGGVADGSLSGPSLPPSASGSSGFVFLAAKGGAVQSSLSCLVVRARARAAGWKWNSVGAIRAAVCLRPWLPKPKLGAPRHRHRHHCPLPPQPHQVQVQVATAPLPALRAI